MSLQLTAPSKKNYKRLLIQRGPQLYPRLPSVPGTQRPQIQQTFQPCFIRPPPPFSASAICCSSTVCSNHRSSTNFFHLHLVNLRKVTHRQNRLHRFLHLRCLVSLALRRNIRSLRGWLTTRHSTSSKTKLFKFTPLLFVLKTSQPSSRPPSASSLPKSRKIIRVHRYALLRLSSSGSRWSLFSGSNTQRRPLNRFI